MNEPSHPRLPLSAVLSAAMAFVLWGVLPIYWKALGHIGTDLALAHRVVWTLLTVLAMLLWRGEFRAWLASLRDLRTVGIHTWSALLLGINWGTFIWASHHGRIVECSIGYFLNPLLNVVIGYVLLGERLNRTQILSIALATVGVVMQILIVGRFPWVSLLLAFSMAFYALARRQSKQGSLSGLATETLVSTPLAIGYLLWAHSQAVPLFGPARSSDVALLIGLGIITAVPLLGFANAARKLPFAVLGLLQFLAPTGQFLFGAFLYHEPVTSSALFSFGFIWLAVLIFCWDLWMKGNKKARNRLQPMAD
jgi:chloramphenicol-sensitive protein RarD